MKNITHKVGSIAIASLFAVLPFAASANTVNASGSTGVVISPSGIVRVIGADVTSVGTNIVNAVLNIGGTVINVVLNTSGNTKIVANGSKTATTTDIKVGDDIAFKGTLASSSAGNLTVNATKVRDVTSSPFPRFAVGTIASVNTANGSFVVSNSGTNTTVTTNASTSIMLNGAAASLGSLPVNTKVLVVGTQNSDGSITATKVMVNTNVSIGSGKDNGKNNNDKNDNSTSTKDGKGNGLHLGVGIGNLFGGLHFGKDN